MNGYMKAGGSVWRRMGAPEVLLGVSESKWLAREMHACLVRSTSIMMMNGWCACANEQVKYELVVDDIV